jgi:hypothetical protein
VSNVHRREGHTVVIGDTMETDILGGMQLGLTTVLVLSGGTKQADLEEYAFRPTHTVETIADLLTHAAFRTIFSPPVSQPRSPVPPPLFPPSVNLRIPEVRESQT